jgi:signal peptidase I
MTSESDSVAPAAAQPAAAGAAEAPKEPKKESWWSFLRFLLLLFLGMVLLRSCIVAPFSIPSASMLPSLMTGDYLFVAKWPYGYSRYSFPFGIVNFDGRVMGGAPERGDIVVFRHPGPDNQDWVKRVIGLPGDQVEIRAGVPVINGQPVQRERIADFLVPVSKNSPCQPAGPATRSVTAENGQSACSYPRFRETLPGGRSYEVLDQIEDVASRRNVDDRTPAGADNVAPFRVPEGHVFAMGDNRDDSMDGRFPIAAGGVGMLPIENIQGRALINFFSTDGSAEWLLPWTWFSAARWDRIGQTYP